MKFYCKSRTGAVYVDDCFMRGGADRVQSNTTLDWTEVDMGTNHIATVML
jgi:hypothetical protein